jgi:hypothetical protein
MKTKTLVCIIGLFVSLLSAIGYGQVGQTPINQAGLFTIAAGQDAPTFGFTIAPAPGLQPNQVSKISMRVLVRAAGLTLKKLNVANYAAKPNLVVYDSGGRVIATNTGWNSDIVVSTVNAQVGAFPLDAPTSFEYDSAVVLELPVGSYTVQVTDNTSIGKRALIELYNADRLPTTGLLRLSNMSLRGVLPITVGMVFDGTGSKPFLFRAIGPTLGLFGVTNTSNDPHLVLYTAQGGKITENDNWGAELAPVFAKVGAFPLATGSKDSALQYVVVSRGPLSITIGSDGTPGVTLVEVYEVPLN